LERAGQRGLEVAQHGVDSIFPRLRKISN
jgi:hypothetical protein